MRHEEPLKEMLENHGVIETPLDKLLADLQRHVSRAMKTTTKIIADKPTNYSLASPRFKSSLAQVLQLLSEIDLTLNSRMIGDDE